MDVVPSNCLNNQLRLLKLLLMSEAAQVTTLKVFKCPCGKQYRSYPALHTHVRKKHEGSAPGPLDTPNSHSRRGRPPVQVHRKHTATEVVEMESLTIIELAILKIVEEDIFEPQDLLKKNQKQTVQFSWAHQYLFKQEADEPVVRGIVRFIRKMTQHFSQMINQEIVRFFSLMLWWMEGNQSPFNLESTIFSYELLNQFMLGGWEEEAKKRNMKMDGKKQGLFRKILTALSHWLKVNGLMKETIA